MHAHRQTADLTLTANPFLKHNTSFGRHADQRQSIMVMAAPALEAYASVKLARQHEPMHVITYNSQNQDDQDALIAHECGHIIRTFSTPPSRRKLASISFADYQKALDANKQDILTALFNAVPANAIERTIQPESPRPRSQSIGTDIG